MKYEIENEYMRLFREKYIENKYCMYGNFK